MSDANVARHTRRASWMTTAAIVAVPVLMLAQPPAGAPQGAPGQRGAGPGAGAPGAPPAGQGRGGRGGQAPAAPGGGRGAGAQAAAPVDLTGYWVSLVTEDWIERMSPDSPPSGTGGTGGGFGGFGGGGGRGRGGGGLPGGPPAAVTNDPCRVYAAGGSLRVPGRLHITWADDNTMKVEMDSGTQTRLFHFGGAQAEAGAKSLQGYSAATWETGGGGGGFGGGGGARGGGAGRGGPRWGSLKVVTTNLAGGYLLSSRDTYADNATLTENFTRHSDFGNDYFTVTAIIDEGGRQRITSSTFKKEADGAKFEPTGCDIKK
jgi:hypothetical protein